MLVINITTYRFILKWLKKYAKIKKNKTSFWNNRKAYYIDTNNIHQTAILWYLWCKLSSLQL